MTSNIKKNPESPEHIQKESKVKYYTFQELNALKSEKDWMIYGDSVYNVRPFIPYHPGGELLIKHLLHSDVTDHLGKFHPAYVTEEKLPQYFMGKIDESTFP
jgi:cytochrome b involved in lipid metabolism